MGIFKDNQRAQKEEMDRRMRAFLEEFKALIFKHKIDIQAGLQFVDVKEKIDEAIKLANDNRDNTTSN